MARKVAVSASSILNWREQAKALIQTTLYVSSSRNRVCARAGELLEPKVQREKLCWTGKRAENTVGDFVGRALQKGA